MQIAQDLLNHQLRAAVGIAGGERVVFSKRPPNRITIHCGGGAEHEGFYPALAHRLQQTQGADHIVVVVGQG